jgi:dihydroxyacetone kinase
MLDGVQFTDDRLFCVPGYNVVARKDHDAPEHVGKAALLAGGSGHDPSPLGFLGQGMLTACAVGPSFGAPSIDAVLTAIHLVAGRAGVLLMARRNAVEQRRFERAAEMARSAGIEVDIVVLDHAIEDDDETELVEWHKTAGAMFVYKVAGAAADAGLSLSDVRDVAQAAVSKMASIRFDPAEIPNLIRRSYNAAENEEGRRKIGSNIENFVVRLIEKLALSADDRVALLINDLGGATSQELNIIARRCLIALNARNIFVSTAMIGAFETSPTSVGCSVSLMKLDDERLAALLTETDASAWRRPGIPASIFRTAASSTAGSPRAFTRRAKASNKADVVRSISQGSYRAPAGPPLRLEDKAVDKSIGAAPNGKAFGNSFDFHDDGENLRSQRNTSPSVVSSMTGPGETLAELISTFFHRLADMITKGEDIHRLSSWADAFSEACSAVKDTATLSSKHRGVIASLSAAAYALSEAAGSRRPASSAALAAMIAAFEEAKQNGFPLR